MTFFNFFFHFWKLHQILNTLRKNMMVIPNVFRKLQTVKNFVRLFSKKHRFGTRFDNQHVKVSRILAKCPLRAILSCFSSFWVKLISKTSPLHLRVILLVFLNTMTAEAKYPIEHSENLPLWIKMKLSEKRKTFSGFFVPFLESTSSVEQKNDGSHSWCISEITDRQ